MENQSSVASVPVSMLSGFLGAGKYLFICVLDGHILRFEWENTDVWFVIPNFSFFFYLQGKLHCCVIFFKIRLWKSRVLLMMLLQSISTRNWSCECINVRHTFDCRFLLQFNFFSRSRTLWIFNSFRKTYTYLIRFSSWNHSDIHVSLQLHGIWLIYEFLWSTGTINGKEIHPSLLPQQTSQIPLN